MNNNDKDIDLLPDQSLGEKLIKKGFWLYVFSFLIAPTWYLIRILISNSVSVEEVWILYSIISFIIIVSTYNWLWLTESLKYFIPKYWNKKEYDNMKTIIIVSLLVQILTSIILIFIMFFAADWLALNYFKDPLSSQILKYFCVYFLWINILQVIQSVIISFQDWFNNRLIELIKMWSTVIFVLIFFLLWKQTIFYYSLWWICWLLIAVIAWLIIFKNKYSKVITKWKLWFDKSEFKKYKKYALWTFFGMNVGIILWQIDQQMVLFMLWSKSAWYYSNYLSILNIKWLLISPIMMIILPIVSELASKWEWVKLNLLNSVFYNYFWVFSISLWFFMIALWPEISLVLFWGKFLFSWYLVQFWAGFIILSILLLYNFNVLAGVSKVKENTKIIFIAVLVNILINYFLIKTIWIYWAIIWTIVWWLIIFVMTFLEIKKTNTIKLNFRFLWFNLLSILILSWIIYFIKWKFFIIDDIYRYRNLFYIIVLWLSYYLVILWLNYKKCFLLKSEIKNIRR